MIPVLNIWSAEVAGVPAGVEGEIPFWQLESVGARFKRLDNDRDEPKSQEDESPFFK